MFVGQPCSIAIMLPIISMIRPNFVFTYLFSIYNLAANIAITVDGVINPTAFYLEFVGTFMLLEYNKEVV